MIFRPSGGLSYHLRARLNRARWEPFAQQVAKWLRTWDVTGPELVLIGPSGGYSLSDEFLGRFTKIDAYDLDPLAHFFFRGRHPHARVRFHRRDVFSHNNRINLSPLREVLAGHPAAAILFCNVLGQLPLEIAATENELVHNLLNLKKLLEGRRWASYHDRFSDRGTTRIDHLTGGLWTADLKKHQMTWDLRRDCRHLVEGVSV